MALEEYDPRVASRAGVADWVALPPTGAGGRDGVGARLWPLGREILAWTKAPFLFRNELVVADAVVGPARAAKPGEVRRLGKHAAIVALAVGGGARIEVAASADGV